MTGFHIYTAAMQPATGAVDNNGPEPFKVSWRPHQRLWAACCQRKRLAMNCSVQCFYDALYIWCAPGKGCKDPKAIAAKRRREFRNRSAGQRARWAKPSAGSSLLEKD